MLKINSEQANFLYVFLGTVILRYCIGLYGFTTVNLAKHFLGSENNILSIIMWFIYSIPYVIRPLSTIFFNSLSKSIGRYNSFQLSLVLMMFSTLLIGIFPGSKEIGILSSFSLLFFHLIQSVSKCAEFPWTTITLLKQYNDPSTKSNVSSYISTAPLIGYLIALFLKAFIPWRYLFYLGAILCAVLYIFRELIKNKLTIFEEENNSMTNIREEENSILKEMLSQITICFSNAYKYPLTFLLVCVMVYFFQNQDKIAMIWLPEYQYRMNLYQGNTLIIATIASCLFRLIFIRELTKTFGLYNLFFISVAFESFLLPFLFYFSLNGNPILGYLIVVPFSSISHGLLFSYLSKETSILETDHLSVMWNMIGAFLAPCLSPIPSLIVYNLFPNQIYLLVIYMSVMSLFTLWVMNKHRHYLKKQNNEII
jgi:MFS family permease